MNQMENSVIVVERFGLAMERIGEIEADAGLSGGFSDYFIKVGSFIERMEKEYRFVESGAVFLAKLEELKENNRELYVDILPENYGNSFANPAYAVSVLGGEYGQILSFLYAELRSLILYAYEQDMFEMTIRAELFLEIYGLFVMENKESGKLPEANQLRQTISSFLRDYMGVETEKRMKERFCPGVNIAEKILTAKDLSDVRYLYYFGDYITEDECRAAAYMNSLSKERVEMIAETFTGGFRRGFEVYKKDMGKKETVLVMYSLGFDRIIKEAIAKFDRMGLKAILRRADFSIFHGGSIMKRGVYGAIANKQYEFDHKDDQAMFLDKLFISRKLETAKNALDQYKKEADLFAGPALFEPFGDIPFEPVNKKEAISLSDKQQTLLVEYMSSSMQMQEEYVKNEETSFTIISFPVPAIGDKYEEVFDAIVDINTLDNKRYSRIQQTIIDALDQADYVQLKGMNGNKTDLKVKLFELKDPAKETNFENCVADVNIPVGEVFTSPVLKGTQGKLHVTKVYLKDLEFKNLSLDFKDGMVVDYDCSNFDDTKENRKFIKEQLLFHHDTLPMGEFAIGTNTTAYAAAKKYGIGHLFPILIAEKMGPHFAVGDTCYFHEEDLAVFNPDGKEIVARENEISALRNTDMSKAYYNCHTDITIPYHELGELSAVGREGSVTPLILEGRFVLAGCEELNMPLGDS